MQEEKKNQATPTEKNEINFLLFFPPNTSMAKERPKNFMSFTFNNNETQDEAAIELIQKQLTNFSQYAVNQFALKDNAIQKVSSQADTLTLRVNGIEKTPFINIDYRTTTTKLNAPMILPLPQPTYEENNADKQLLVQDNAIIFNNPGVYMISYAISASVLSNYSWLDVKTNIVIPGSVLNITKINSIVSLTTFVRVPPEEKLFVKLQITAGKLVSILAPSRISVSGPLFYGKK
jgi:hypothetical protein